MTTLKIDRNILLLSVFTLITFFVSPGALPTDIMESRNIVTGREMVADGNWLVPTMNGELRLEKPPLPTWIAGAVEELAPGSLAAQRVAAGVAGCLWVASLFFLARYVSRRDDYAVAAAVVFLTCYNLVLMGRSATWDIYCHAFMAAAIYVLTRALCERRRAGWRLVGAGALMGLSFLSKGPVSFYTMLLPYVVAMALFLRTPEMRLRLPAWRWVAGALLVLLLVGGWWYVFLFVVHPEEAAAVFQKESGNWSAHNVRPWYYYWRFFLEMGVWAVLMVASLAFGYWRRRILLRREYLFSFVWSVGCLILLSLMPEKKTRYLLPLLAPCSMLVATLLIHFGQGKRRMDRFCRWLWTGNGWLTALIVAAIPFLAYFLGLRGGKTGWAATAAVGIIALVAAGLIVWAVRNYRPMLYVAAIAVAFAGVELFLLPVVGSAFGNPQRRSIHLLSAKPELAHVAFYHSDKEPLRIELVYEAGHKILPLNLRDGRLVMSRLPMVLVTRCHAREELPAEIIGKVDTVSYGFFDDNKHARSDKHYNKAFLNCVTLVKQKR